MDATATSGIANGTGQSKEKTVPYESKMSYSAPAAPLDFSFNYIKTVQCKSSHFVSGHRLLGK